MKMVRFGELKPGTKFRAMLNGTLHVWTKWDPYGDETDDNWCNADTDGGEINHFFPDDFEVNVITEQKVGVETSEVVVLEKWRKEKRRRRRA